MAIRVPDSNTFALSTVVAVVELTSDSGTFSSASFDPASGKTQLNGAFNTDVEINDTVTVTGSSYYNGSHLVMSRTSSTIVINTIFTSTDTGSWDLELLRQTDCFQAAESAKFDPSYSGSKDRLSNFRNYGPMGNLTQVDAEDNGGFYSAIDGQAAWFYITSGSSGLRRYDMDVDGVLTLAHTMGAPGNESFQDISLASLGNELWITSYNSTTDRYWLHHMSVSAIDGSYDLGAYTGTEIMNITYAGTFVYVTARDGGTGFGIKCFNWSGGVINYKSSYVADSAKYYKGAYYVDDAVNYYLIMPGNNGTSIFSINATTGFLTKIDTDNTGTYIGTDIAIPLTYDTDSFYFLVTTVNDGIYLYRLDGSENLVYKDSDTLALELQGPAIHKASSIVYCTRAGYVRRYSISKTAWTISFIAEQSLSNVERVFIWDEATGFDPDDILIASHGWDGIKTYSIDA
jgi:hypothetical protein